MSDTELEELLVIAIGGLMIRSDKPHPTIGEIVDTILPLINKNQLALIDKIEGSLPAEYIIENQAYKSHDDLTYESGWKNGQTKTLSEVTTILKQAKEGLDGKRN